MIMSIDVPMGQKRFKVDIRGLKLGVSVIFWKKSGIFTVNMIMSIDVPMGQKSWIWDVRGLKLGVWFTDNLNKSWICFHFKFEYDNEH